MIFMTGYYITNLHKPDSEFTVAGSTSTFIVQVLEPPVEKANSYKITGKIIEEHSNNKTTINNEKIIIYFEKDSLITQIQYGDQLMLNAILNEVKPPQNPNEFNYKKYLLNKGIVRQTYVRGTKWEKLSSGNGNPVFAFGYKLRNHLLQILEENNIAGKEFAVASAILLGYDDKLDKDLVSEFSGSGAMHILCVSGLHVGIIYVIFNGLLFFLSRKKWQRLLKVILLILLIWIYALITGFSPSVLRASTMFSFIIIGQSLNRKSSVYNSLAASAFILLIFNPFYIVEVGFQLSYLAVTGIIMIYPLIYKLWIPENVVVRKTWSLIVVSIAAQIATFPLSLYYFHQFPNFFIITNLIAIPASTLIIYSGLLVLFSSPVPVISSIFAKVLSWTIQSLNASVKFIENAPYSSLKDIHITTIELFLFYLLSISMILAIYQKRKVIFLASLSLFVVLFSSFTIRKFSHLQQQEIIVYNIRNYSAIDIINGKSRILLADSTLLSDEGKQLFHIKNHIVFSGITESSSYDIDSKEIENNILFRKDNFLQFSDKRLLIINSGFKVTPDNSKFNLDYIIIRCNPRIDLKELASSYNFSKIIFDSSNSRWKIKEWISECQESGIDFHDVNSSGAWQLSL